MFNIVIEQFAALQKANLDQITKASALAFSQTERAVAWNVGVAKDLSNELLADAKTVAAAKDPQSVAALPRLVEGKAEKYADFGRLAYDHATRAQAETAKFFEGAAAEYNTAFVKFVENVAKAAPVGGDAFVQQFKQAVAAQQAAAEQATQAFKQASSNVTSAAQTAVNAVAKKGRK